jgi:glycosyltransferase involved in cell wall biosynthesis
MRPDVPQILGASDVFVLSSRGWEGLPLAVLEAMASSLPVVASDVGGTREAVIDGQTGLLYAPRDSDALAQRLRALHSDSALSQRMGRAGLARVEECFTVQRMVNETAALYEALAHQREISSGDLHT